MKRQPYAQVVAQRDGALQAAHDLRRCNAVLERRLQEKVDVTMLQERRLLAAAIGQLIQAATEAVKFIVAKGSIVTTLVNVPNVRYGPAPTPTELYPVDVQRQWVRTVNENRDTLNEWEMHFIVDITAKLAKGWTLSDKQITKLETIYANRT